MDNASTFTISSEKYSSKTLRVFRHVTRVVSGESLEPGDTDLVLFGRIKGHKTDVVSVACGRPQKIYISDNPQDEDLYHWINFLFVMKDFQDQRAAIVLLTTCDTPKIPFARNIESYFIVQGNGFGKQMLTKMEDLLWFQAAATIRIESASRAVPFFKKMGYTEVGQPIECVHSGSALFRTLQMMEKPFQRGS